MVTEHSAPTFDEDVEERILASGVREIFTPHKPIRDRKFFHGRGDQVLRLVQAINTPGQHALLFGERGVGKSSLANHLLDVARKPLTITIQCDSGSTFKSIAMRALSRTGTNSDQLLIPLTEPHPSNLEFAPSYAAEQLGKLDGLLLIDEADAISTRQDRRQVADFMKILSDNDSKFKVLVVGIADTGTSLVGAHPSVGRCLREVQLMAMSDTEISAIVTSGAQEAKLIFAPSLVRQIVKLSGGYPHFTHLLALKCSERAIELNLPIINDDVLSWAMKQASADAEASLTSAYRDATRSYGTLMYEKVLMGCAATGKVEFTAGDLRSSISRVTGTGIKQQGLNNYLKGLVTGDDDATDDSGDDAEDTTAKPVKILRRMAKGVYRFRDPRMATYIKIATGMVE